MPRYGTLPQRPKAMWIDDEPLIPSLQVDVCPPQDTGIMDAKGNPLYRFPDTVGFLSTKKFTER